MDAHLYPIKEFMIHNSHMHIVKEENNEGDVISNDKKLKRLDELIEESINLKKEISFVIACSDFINRCTFWEEYVKKDNDFFVRIHMKFNKPTVYLVVGEPKEVRVPELMSKENSILKIYFHTHPTQKIGKPSEEDRNIFFSMMHSDAYREIVDMSIVLGREGGTILIPYFNWTSWYLNKNRNINKTSVNSLWLAFIYNGLMRLNERNRRLTWNEQIPEPLPVDGYLPFIKEFPLKYSNFGIKSPTGYIDRIFKLLKN